MYRVTVIRDKYYALKIDNIEDDIDNINILVNSRELVIICNQLSDLEVFDIYEKI